MTNYQVRIDQKLFDETVYNITYWTLPDDQLTTLQTFVNSLKQSWAINVQNYHSDKWQLLSCTFREMEGNAPFSLTIPPTTGPLVGGDTGNVLPTQIALLVSTLYAGEKPNRGRIYFSGLSADGITPTADFDPVWATDFSTMVTTWGVAGLGAGVGNAFLRIARPNFVANTWTLSNPVEGTIGQQNPATQTRRRKGVGI